jgi:hypothetical protein
MIITSTIFFISPALRLHFVAINKHNILSYDTIITGLQVESMDFVIYPAPFSPKAMNMGCLAGLLTCPGLVKPSHPPAGGQWQGITKPSSLERSGITAAGTVADSDRIPFSLQ